MFKYLSKLTVSLQAFVRVMQLNLFRKCSLEELFDPPPETGTNTHINRQLEIAFR